MMKNILFGSVIHNRAVPRGHWFAQTKRHLLWVPHQTPAAQTQRPAGLFGVLVSPYL